MVRLSEDTGAPAKTVAHVFFSPSGSTRKTGRMICSMLEEKGYSISEFDLTHESGRNKDIRSAIGSSSILLVGSPVYGGSPAFPVMEFLKELSPSGGKPGLVYVTYGAVSKGSALLRIAKTLDKKGYKVIGLAAVVAEHSMMFRSGNPLGKGHPGEDDRGKLQSWIGSIAPKLENDGAGSIDYSQAASGGIFEKLMPPTGSRPEFHELMFPRIKLIAENCDSCGACAVSCPAGRLDNLPEVDGSKHCLRCYQCARVCKNGALKTPLWVMQPMLRVMAVMSGGLREPETSCYK